MRGDMPIAALRLMAALPVRTHLCLSIADRSARDGGTWSSAKRRIRIGGRTFESVTMAKASLGCGLKKIYKMLASGKASYE